MKKKLVYFSVFLVTFVLVTICLLPAETKLILMKRMGYRQPNILLLSFCSLRPSNMSLYGYERDTTPHMKRFFSNNSLVGTNVFNSQSWSSIFSFFEDGYIDTVFLNRFGYTPVAGAKYFIDGLHSRIPLRQSYKEARRQRFFNDNAYKKDFKEDLEYFKQALLKHREKPFFAGAHIRYLHFPLIDRFNPEAEWSYYLSAEEKQLIEEYLSHPEDYPDKLALFLILKYDIELVKNFPQIKGEWDVEKPQRNNRFLGLLDSPPVIDQWKKSIGYEKDLEIIRKIYDANVRYLDQFTRPLLDLFGDSELQANTIVVMTGDHGEEHMEHGSLSHGHTVFDEALKVPLAIKYAGPDSAAGRRKLDRQIYMGEVAEVLKDFVGGEVDQQNLHDSLLDRSSGVLVARNCNNSLGALRLNNRWKLILDLASGKRSLYDLQADPGETEDIFQEMGEKAAELEAVYFKKFSSVRKPDAVHCSPWP